MARFVVDVAEYQGDGYWADYPPLDFDTREEAENFKATIETLSQVPSPDGMIGRQKVRGIREI